RRVPAVVGKLLDQILVAIAKLVLGHIGEAECVLGEVLNEILERSVGQLRLVRPRSIAEDALQPIRIDRLNGLERAQKRSTNVLWRGADVLPMRAIWNREAVVGRGDCILLIASFPKCFLVVLVPDVAEPL